MLHTASTRSSSAMRWLLIFGLIAGCSADEGNRGDGRPPGTGGSGGAGGTGGAGGQAAGSGSGGFGGIPAGSGGSGGSNGSGNGNECGSVDVDASRVTPTVELVVDASGSMDEDFQGGSCNQRWTCLRDALVNDTDGLVHELQGVVNFGLTLFRGGDGGGGWSFFGGGGDNDTMDTMCPQLTRVPAALNNYDAIAQPYMEADPDGSTPTAQALETVIAELGSGTLCPDCTSAGPPIIILVSDGDPNGCDDNDEETFAETEAQAQAAWDAGIELYVMALADDQNLDHVQRLANIGVGNAPDATPPAPYFAPSNAEDLRSQLESIIGGAAGCEVALQSGEVEGDPSGGEVLLNSDELEYQGEDGWELVDPTHIRLLGAACDEWLNNSQAILSASFDCSVVIQ